MKSAHEFLMLVFLCPFTADSVIFASVCLLSTVSSSVHSFVVLCSKASASFPDANINLYPYPPAFLRFHSTSNLNYFSLGIIKSTNHMMSLFSMTPPHTRCENLIVSASQHVWKLIKSSWQCKNSVCVSLATKYKCRSLCWLNRKPRILLFSMCATTNLYPASSKIYYKISNWGNMNFTLPVNPVNS